MRARRRGLQISGDTTLMNSRIRFIRDPRINQRAAAAAQRIQWAIWALPIATGLVCDLAATCDSIPGKKRKIPPEIQRKNHLAWQSRAHCSSFSGLHSVVVVVVVVAVYKMQKRARLLSHIFTFPQLFPTLAARSSLGFFSQCAEALLHHHQPGPASCCSSAAVMIQQQNLVMLLLVSSLFGFCCCAAPASFVFGDSLVDSGNNDYLVSLSKADQPWNGIDFPGGRPTGRFCNGRTIPDIIGQAFGIPFAPPYLAPSTTGEAILRGVNYGSGGGGILDETGLIFVGRLSLWKQLQFFQNTTMQLKSLLGEPSTAEFLARSIFSVTIGSNDYLNNYLLPVPLTVDTLLTPNAFQDKLISTYRQQLTVLYRLGARKIIVAAIGPIGCIPYQLTINLRKDGTCLPGPNALASAFNVALRSLVTELNANLPAASFIYANSYDIVYDMITRKSNYGFESSNVACCGLGGPYRGLIPCQPDFRLCSDRSKYFFWDAYHPSDGANRIVASRLLDGDAQDVSPVNVRRLFES